jgi:serine/threonine protein kinase
LGESDEPVFKAEHQDNGQLGVVRFLPRSKLDDADWTAGLKRDIDAVQSIGNPHIAKLTGLHEKDGQPFVVAEYVSGVDLQQVSDRGTALTVEQATEVVEQIALGLDALHSEGIPHGDVCPAHIQIAPTGEAKLLNAGAFAIYGQSAAVSPQRAGQTTSSSLGHFLRVDVLGLVLTLAYLTGDPERRSRAFASFVHSIRSDAWPDTSHILAALPDPLQDAVQQALGCLDSRPDEAAGELAHALRLAAPRSTALDSLVDQTESPPTEKRPASDSDESEVQIQPDGQQLRSIRSQAAFATLACFLVPVVAIFGTAIFHAVKGGNFLQTRLTPSAQVLLTLPGQNGTWWPDDPHTFFLTPPIRDRLVDEGVLPKETPASYHKWFSEEGLSEQGDFGDRLAAIRKEVTLASEFLDAKRERSNPFTNIGELGIYFDQLAGKKSAVDLHLRAVIAHQIGNNWASDGSETEDQGDIASDAAESETDEEGTGSEDHAGPITPQSKAEWYDQAERDYQQALAKYAKYPMVNHALIARCRADMAMLFDRRGLKLKAARHWNRARQDANDGTRPPTVDADNEFAKQAASAEAPDESVAFELPKSDGGKANLVAVEFAVSCLCKEAQVYRGLGQWSKAKLLLDEALRVLDLKEVPVAPGGGRAYDDYVNGTSERATTKAYVFERLGWLNMDAWRISQAKDCFEIAKRFRKHEDHFPKHDDSIRTELLALHDMHGLAMSHRYSGETDKAIADYNSILKELANDDKTLELTGEDRLVYGTLREERLLNSRERFADCFLFGPLFAPDQQLPQNSHQDPIRVLTETLDEIRRRQLLKQTRGEQLARILHKIALEHVRQGEFEMARQRLQEADLHHPPAEHSERFRFLSEIVRSCIPPKPAEAQTPRTSITELAELFEQFGSLLRLTPFYVPLGDGPPADREAICGTTLMTTLHDQFVSLRSQGKIKRDELDIALYAAVLLFRADHLADDAAERAPREYIELLSKLAHYPLENATVHEKSDKPMSRVLPYLRGVYVAAIHLALEADPPRTDVAFELFDQSHNQSAATSVRNLTTVLAVPGEEKRTGRLFYWKKGESPDWLALEEGEEPEDACKRLPAEWRDKKHVGVRELIDSLDTIQRRRLSGAELEAQDGQS